MPRDSSGNYTLPLGNPVIDGTVIDVNWANPTMSDIAVQLNNVLTRDGLLGPTGPFYSVDGTPALPGLAFAAQHGTGLWRDATQVGLSYAGVALQVWNATGSQINGNLNVTGNVNVVGTGPYVKKTGDTMTGALTISGPVSPLALDSANPAAISVPFRINGNPVGYLGTGILNAGAGGTNFTVRSELALLFATGGGVERMHIDTAGNVGIGIVPGNAKLHVAGNALLQTAVAGELNYSLTSGGSVFVGLGLNLTGATNGYGVPSGSAYFAVTGANPLVFGTNNVERMRIDAAGIVYINTPTAESLSSRLNLSYNRTVEHGIGIRPNNDTGPGVAVMFYNAALVSVGSIQAGATSTAYVTTSDYRLKSNVVDLVDQGALIDALRPRAWVWADGSRGVGFVAHEIAAVMPSTVVGEKDAVDADDKPVYQQMSYSAAELITSLVAAVKDLRTRVTNLGG